MSSINALNRGTVEVPKKFLGSSSQETNFSSSNSDSAGSVPCCVSKSVSFSSFVISSPRSSSEETINIAKVITLEKQRNHNQDGISVDNASIEKLCNQSVVNQEKNEFKEETKASYFSSDTNSITKIGNGVSDDSGYYSTGNNVRTAVPLAHISTRCKSSDEIMGNVQLESCPNRNVQLSKCSVSSASVQTDFLSCRLSPPPAVSLQDQGKLNGINTNENASNFILSPPKSSGKHDDEVISKAGTTLESSLFEHIQPNGQKNTTINDVWHSFKGERKVAESQYFLLRFAKTDKTLLLRDEDVIDQFEYFAGITEGNFCESRTQVIEMSEHLPYEIAQLVFQQESKMLNSLKKENVCSAVEALDYLGFKYSDEFIHQLFRRIHRHRWTEEKSFASELVHSCAYTNIGVHLMSYLKRSPGIISSFLSKEGGKLIAEMCEKNPDRTIFLLNDICHNLCSCKPESKDVVEFIIAATQQETLVDALADIWDPTLWYSTEKKSVAKNAMSDGPHQVGEVDVELYADSDNQGSSTTVNICMNGGSPLDGSTPLSQVTNIGVYASTRGKATYVYTCFTARAKFKLKDCLLGEATFDLYPDGVKAFCPVVSGGPHMHGLQLTCRIDDKVKELKEDYRNRHSLDIGNQRIDDISVELKSRQFPFRGLTLYLLHNAVLQSDFEFVTLFASALQSDVCEWLGTYLTPLWVQQSFPDHSYSYIAPSNLNSLPSPFVVLQHWFADARVPIDTWCSKTIMGELFQSNHFQLLMSRHFSDCLNFIKSCKKWIDTESLLLFREKLIEFVSHKPHIVGALLFDLACEAMSTQTKPGSYKRHISDLIFHDVKEAEAVLERSNNCNSVAEDTCNATNIAAQNNRRPCQQIVPNAPNKQSQSAGIAALPSCCAVGGSKSMINRQTATMGDSFCRNREVDGAGSIRISSSSLCNAQVNGKHRKVLEDALKEVENIDLVPHDWIDNVKESTSWKSKRCRLC